MQTYFITGGAGFVGANLVRALVADAANQVHLLIKPSTSLWRLSDIADKSNLHFHHGDLTGVFKLARLVKKIQPTYIYHLAARGAYASQNDPTDIFTANTLGTLHLLQAAEQVPYRLLVNVGSSSEYGFKSQPMSELDRLEPNSFYAIAKASATHLSSYWATHYQRPVVTVRLFSVYGPFEEPTRFFPTLLRALHTGQPMSLVDPTISRDFIFVDDVVDLLQQTEQLAQYSGHVFNAGTGGQSTLAEVVQLAEQVAGAQLLAEWGEMPARQWDTTSWVADTSLVKQQLQWQPRGSLETGLQKMWQWYQSHYDLYEKK